MAILAATIRNTFVDKKTKATSPADFLPRWTIDDEE